MHGSLVRRCLVGLAIGLAVCGCAGTRMQEVEVYQTPSQPLAKFLIVGIHDDGRVRRLFENAFVKELTEEGIEGVQSYRFIFEERAVTAANVERAVQESRADAVITVRAVQVNMGSQNPWTTSKETFAFDVYPHTPERSLLPSSDQVTLQLKVFDAANRNLLILATSRAVRPDSVQEIGQDICREMVKSLSNEKFLQR